MANTPETPETPEQAHARKMILVEHLTTEINRANNSKTWCGVPTCGYCRIRRDYIAGLEAERDALAAEIEGRTPAGDINDLPASARPKRERPDYVEGAAVDENAVVRERITDLEARLKSAETHNEDLMRANNQAQLALNEKIERVSELEHDVAVLTNDVHSLLDRNRRLKNRLTHVRMDRDELSKDVVTLANDLVKVTGKHRRATEHIRRLVQERESLAITAPRGGIQFPSPPTLDKEVLAEKMKQVTERFNTAMEEFAAKPPMITAEPTTTVYDPVRREIALAMAVDLAKTGDLNTTIVGAAREFYKFLMGSDD